MSRAKGGSAVSAEALAVLAASTVQGTNVKLPPGQLPRPLYVEVNEVLTRLGGKWKGGKVAAHVFGEIDPKQQLAEVVATGTMPAKNPTAFFATPGPVVLQLVQAARVFDLNEDGRIILEPSAGHGAIADGIRRAAPRATLDTIEILERSATVLRSHGFTVHEADFLAFTSSARYDAVVMNPPFAVEGDALAYITHIERAVELLKPGGRLAAIAPAGLCFRDDRRTSAFRERVLESGVIEELPEDSFVASGTAVRTVLLTMRAAA